MKALHKCGAFLRRLLLVINRKISFSRQIAINYKMFR